MNNLEKALALFLRDTEASPPLEQFRVLLAEVRAKSAPASGERIASWRRLIAQMSDSLWDALSSPPHHSLAGVVVTSSPPHPEGPPPIARVASLVLNDVSREGVALEITSRPRIDAITGVLSLRLRVPEGTVAEKECAIALVRKIEREIVAEQQHVYLGVEVESQFQLPRRLAEEWGPVLAHNPPPNPTDYPFALLLTST